MNKQKIRDRILSSVTMLTEPEIPSSCAEQGLRFEIHGNAAVPAFQIDADQDRILPVMTEILNLRPHDWSDLRILEWLTRPHLNFGCAPCDALTDRPDEVLAAFRRAIVPPTHG